jgi:aryl-alcohol dehydrogenase-like predicted oxidoreductase
VALPTRRLGRSGLNITRLGFGSWAIGGGDWAFGWGRQEDQQSLATMRRAVDAGINWIDTAAIYGPGHAEKVVGQFLRQMPAANRPLVFTECGLILDPRLDAGSLTLAPSDLDAIATATAQTGAGSGPLAFSRPLAS